MTFDLTAEQQDWSRRAREFSHAIVSRLAAAIDQHGIIPNELREALSSRSFANPFSAGAIAASVVVEEIAAVSAGVATALGLEWTGQSNTAQSEHGGLPGLRGSSPEGETPSHAGRDRARLVLCSVAVGVGRAAISLAVDVLKSRGIRPSGDETTPHWALADAAAELDAARLLTLSGAQTVERGEEAGTALSIAARLSSTAAERSVEAASLVVGVDGYRPGTPLERYTRDARTLKLLLAV